ncbi:sensor domain-containing diguanylate cyclase [Vibrio sp. SCSIO 43135]|uniref:GGDEF domain-containing protein n=1 Tax=Vibrio sp. SCSIO 43135 TaxID=2819096 RepID=UPI0020758872|nr:sensor domain-containing diguanylate cyclase [Vibrio sp. SCSIO 43135]
MTIIVGMTYARYNSEWSIRVSNATSLAVSHLSSQLTFLSGSIAGRNYANLVMPTTKENILNIPDLIFLEVKGVSDYQSQPVGVRYLVSSNQVWRTDVTDEEIEALQKSYDRIKGMMDGEDEGSKNKKLTYVLNKIENDLYGTTQSKILHDSSRLHWTKPNFSSSDSILKLEHNELHLKLPLRNKNGGEIWAVLDASKLNEFRAELISCLLKEALIALFVSMVLIYWVTLWIVSPLKHLSHSMKQDIEHIEQHRPVEIVRKDEIGDLARAYMSLIKKIKNQLKVLQLQTDTDPLTGLGSRYKYARYSESFLALSFSQGDHVGYLVCDIDNFKAYNDSYGHIEGDNTLTMVANAISDAVSGNDLACRLGGEEFIVLVRASCNAEVFAIAQRINSAVENLNILHVNNPPYKKVTISIGAVAIGPQCRSDSEFLDDILSKSFKQADISLYQCKANGRNTVICESYDSENQQAS